MKDSSGVEIPQGEEREIDGRMRVHYYDYWIKAYPIPRDSLSTKKSLIDALTRRLFNHTEFGLNIPGTRLDEARAAYAAETDPAKRRVKAAMLAGACFNRATAIFTKLVEIQALGVEIKSGNHLMRECSERLQESLTFGKMVMHRSGDEGIDELWGEPFKAFTYPISEFFESRYIKISLAMRDIDHICKAIIDELGEIKAFAAIVPSIRNLCKWAKVEAETMSGDVDIFDVRAEFKVACERVQAFNPQLPTDADLESEHEVERGRMLLLRGGVLISDIARARVPMPTSMREYIESLVAYRNSCVLRAALPPTLQPETRYA